MKILLKLVQEEVKNRIKKCQIISLEVFLRRIPGSLFSAPSPALPLVISVGVPENSLESSLYGIRCLNYLTVLITS
jgi:hypothetical protein